MLNKHPWQAGIEPYIKGFEALTGIKVTTEVYLVDQFRAKVLVELTAGAGDIDVFMTMPAQDGAEIHGGRVAPARGRVPERSLHHRSRL